MTTLHNAVGIVIRLRAGRRKNRDSIFGAGKRNLPLIQILQIGCGAIPYSMRTRSFPGDKAARAWSFRIASMDYLSQDLFLCFNVMLCRYTASSLGPFTPGERAPRIHFGWASGPVWMLWLGGNFLPSARIRIPGDLHVVSHCTHWAIPA